MAMLALALYAAPSSAVRHTVTPETAGRAAGLTAALKSATPGDTLLLRPGTYRGSFILPRGVSLLSLAGADSTVLDADGERYVLFGQHLDSTTVIRGFTIRNGRRDHPNSGGGGIYLHRASPIVTGNVFSHHLGYFGPGVYANYESSPVIAYNQFYDNEGYLGGAIAAYQKCAPLVYNNVLHGNRAVSGGAVLCQNSIVFLANNTLVANRARPGGGGAIYCESSAILLESNVIAGNFDSKPDGGSIYGIDPRRALLRDNLFWRNEGGAEGGQFPISLGSDGNCESDPAFTADGFDRRPSPGACASAAGVRRWDPARIPAVPDSVLERWREWRRVNR
jgi:hypothetical protein